MSKQLRVAQFLSHWLILGLIFLLPWQARWIAIPGELSGTPWEYGTISLYAVDIIFALFAFFALVAIKLQKRKFAFSVQDILAIFLVIISLLSISFATNTLSSVFWLLKLAKGAALFLLIRHLSLPKEHIALAFTFSGVLQAVLALGQFFTQRVWGNTLAGMSQQLPEDLGVQVVQTASERILRAYGSLPHPNMLAGFLVVAIIAAIGLYVTRKHFIERLAVGMSIAVMATGLWTTFSRQAIIALSVAVVLLVTYTFIHERTFPRSVVLAILYVLLPLLTFSAIYSDVIISRSAPQPTNRLEQRSLSEREQYMEDSLTLLRSDWIHGVGIGGFTSAIYKHDADRDQLREGWTYQPVHNIYLLAFTELGIFGALAFTFFILSLAFNLHIRNQWQLTWGLSVVALLTIGLFDHYLWSQHFGILLFWITAGLLTNIDQK